jgi:hypothetical protein
MRVEAMASPAPAATPPRPLLKPVMAKLAPLVLAAVAEAKREEARLTTPKVEVAKAAPPAPPPVHRTPSHRAPAPARMATPDRSVELAEAAAARAVAAQKAQAHRLELAKAARTEKLRLAQAEKLEAMRQAKADKLKADKAETIRLAKAEAKGRAEARAEARTEALAEAKEEAQKQIRLASLVRTIKRALPHEAKPPTRVVAAKLDRKHARPPRHEPAVQQASLKSHKAPHAALPPSRSRPPIDALPPRSPALMKVSTPRCASRDPGEALVCADPSLGAADRQLARAYQGARAAGVPDAQLQRQQQRWLAARAAAAREAPWAVRDVYLARIAELNGLAHDAHGDGY